MGILIKKDRGLIYLTPIAKISLVGLIVSLSSSLIDTVWALHLDSFLHSPVAVGLLSTIFTTIAFISYFVIIPIIERGDKAKIFSISLFVFAISYFLFSYIQNIYLFILIAIVITITSTFRVTSYGLMIRDHSLKKGLARNEGLIYTSLNIAWVIGPLIAGFILSKFGVSKVFLIALAIVICGLILFISFHLRGNKGKKKIDDNLLENFKEFFKDKERVIAYALSGGVNMWWVLSYLFIPLLIVRSAIGTVWVGYFFFALALPLIVLEYSFSKWANKHGFKKLFKLGYLGPAIIALSCFFISNIYIILGLLAFASIFIAMIEPTTEAYFFDILKGKERYRFYAPYNTAIDAGFLVAKITSTAVLFFFPFKFIFLTFSILMFLLFLLSFKTKNIIENK